MLFEKASSCIEINSEFWSCQGLTLKKKKQILTGLVVTKIYKDNEDFFIQLLYAWLHLTSNNFPALIYVEEILDQPKFKTHTPNWTLSIPPKNTSDQFTIVRTFADFYN